MAAAPLLVVEDLKTHFFTRRGVTKAVANAVAALDGRMPASLVNPAVLESSALRVRPQAEGITR